MYQKFFEGIIHSQTQSYLDKHQILYKYQSGFRPKHSTGTCITLLNNNIPNGSDRRLLTGMILIELQKAFDTVDHEMFLMKLECMGFGRSTILWFKSYLKTELFR